MDLENWKRLIKQVIGPGEFRQIALAFLHEHYRVSIVDTDGKGDRNIDAWIVLSPEPRVRIPAQFHAGKSQSWDQKLQGEVAALHASREAMPAEDPRRQDLLRLKFVCTQETDKTVAERRIEDLRTAYGISVEIFDAGAIASAALQNRGRLLQLLAECLPGATTDTAELPPSAREQLLRAFAFFHPQPAKFRADVAKSAIGTVLQRAATPMPRTSVLSEAAKLLNHGSASPLLERAIEHLQLEHCLVIEEPELSISPAFAAMTATAMKIAAADERDLHGKCVQALEPLLAKGTHHRGQRAARAVDAVFGDLGLLVRASVIESAVSPWVPRSVALTRRGSELQQRWRALERRLAAELDLDEQGLRQALTAVVTVVAAAPFAHNLAAAELFLRLTEFDADELPKALGPRANLRIVLDASICLPMFCACYDRPAPSWQTSLAADTLYRVLRSRGATVLVPSPYVEEMAAHLCKAWAFVDLIETQPELERSQNFFVAHYCAARGEHRSSAEFREFLTACGAGKPALEQWQQKRQIREAERTLASNLEEYGLQVVDVEVRDDDPRLADEPARDPILVRHDRAVVRWLGEQPAGTALCTADRWLQAVLGKLDITAADSAAMTDLLGLLRPSDAPLPFLTPLAIAQTLTEDHRQLAAAVWDELVALEGLKLADWKLRDRAKKFHKSWLAGHENTSGLSAEWLRFRDVPA